MKPNPAAFSFRGSKLPIDIKDHVNLYGTAGILAEISLIIYCDCTLLVGLTHLHSPLMLSCGNEEQAPEIKPNCKISPEVRLLHAAMLDNTDTHKQTLLTLSCTENTFSFYLLCWFLFYMQ